jgi:hypothetical protein
MRLGIMADIHGNDVALRAVLDDAARCHVDRWWVLGDRVLPGPRPAEVLGLLRPLPGGEMLRGNTDRYVLTGEQPAPHANAADAAGSAGLVERYGLMAAGIGWTRGVLCQAGLLGTLAGCRVNCAWVAVGGLKAEHRMVPFDVDAVAGDLRARLHPNAEFVEAILTGKRQQIREPAAS